MKVLYPEKFLAYLQLRKSETVNILHGYGVKNEKSITRVTVLHDKACGVMLNSDPK